MGTQSVPECTLKVDIYTVLVNGVRLNIPAYRLGERAEKDWVPGLRQFLQWACGEGHLYVEDFGGETHVARELMMTYNANGDVAGQVAFNVQHMATLAEMMHVVRGDINQRLSDTLHKMGVSQRTANVNGQNYKVLAFVENLFIQNAWKLCKGKKFNIEPNYVTQRPTAYDHILKAVPVTPTAASESAHSAIFTTHHTTTTLPGHDAQVQLSVGSAAQYDEEKNYVGCARELPRSSGNISAHVITSSCPCACGGQATMRTATDKRPRDQQGEMEDIHTTIHRSAPLSILNKSTYTRPKRMRSASSMVDPAGIHDKDPEEDHGFSLSAPLESGFSWSSSTESCESLDLDIMNFFSDSDTPE